MKQYITNLTKRWFFAVLDAQLRRHITVFINFVFTLIVVVTVVVVIVVQNFNNNNNNRDKQEQLLRLSFYTRPFSGSVTVVMVTTGIIVASDGAVVAKK